MSTVPFWRQVAVLTLLLVGALTAPAQEANEATRVRVLLVLDTLDRQGAAWGLDGDNMKVVLEATMKKLGLQDRFTIDMFTGPAAEPKKVLNYYRELDTNPNETLLFYFSGHGGYHGKKGHFIALTLGRLFRNDLIAAMQTKKPRQVVLMTDCCANVQPMTGALFAEPAQHKVYKDKEEPMPAGQRAVVGEPPAKVIPGRQPVQVVERPLLIPNIEQFLKPAKKAKQDEPPHQERQAEKNGAPGGEKARVEEPPTNERKRPPVILRTAKGNVPLEDVLHKINGEPLRHLLFRHRGLVDLNGCEKGELSNGTTFWGGSLFTIAFLQLQTEDIAALDRDGDGFVDWNEFFAAWKDGTERAGRRITNGALRQVPAIFQFQAEPTR